MKTLPQLFSSWAEKCPEECRPGSFPECDYDLRVWDRRPEWEWASLDDAHIEKKTALAVWTACERRGWGFKLSYSLANGDGERLYDVEIYEHKASAVAVEVYDHSPCPATAALSAYLEMISKVEP